MAKRQSPAAAARARLAAKYDDIASTAQELADLKRPDKLNPDSTYLMDDRAARARTLARAARRRVGPRGEKIESTIPEIVPPAPPPARHVYSWEKPGYRKPLGYPGRRKA